MTQRHSVTRWFGALGVTLALVGLVSQGTTSAQTPLAATRQSADDGDLDQPGATIQFDTKGVNFGPWLRRFVNQVRRNWFVPQAAMVFSGDVVLQFNIHRDGAITDIVVVQPSSIDAFTNAAYGAIMASKGLHLARASFPLRPRDRN